MNPVTEKGLRAASRGWFPHVSRGVYVALSSWIVYDHAQALMARAFGGSFSDFAFLGREVYSRFVIVHLVLVAVAAAATAAERLPKEARLGTLDVLATTPLAFDRIVRGEWLAAALQVGALALCGVPVAAICVYLGGIGLAEAANVCIWSAAFATLGPALALKHSARRKSGAPAFLRAVLVLAILVLPAISQCSPGVPVIPVIPLFMMLGASRALLRATEGLHLRAAGVSDEWESLRERRSLAVAARYEATKTRPPRVRRAGRWVSEDRPLLWKEFVLRPALRIPRGTVWMLAFVVVAMMGFSRWISDGPEVFLAWMAAFTIAALISGILLFGYDKDANRWLLLLSSPVSDGSLVGNKLLAGLIFPESLILMALAFLPHLIWPTPWALLPAAVIFQGFAYLLGAATALFARTVRGAFTGSVAFLAALLFAPGLWDLLPRDALGLNRGLFETVVRALSPMSAIELDSSKLLLFALYPTLGLLLAGAMVARVRSVAYRT